MCCNCLYKHFTWSNNTCNLDTFIICAKKSVQNFCRKWRSSHLTTSQFPGPNTLRTDIVKFIVTTAGIDKPGAKLNSNHSMHFLCLQSSNFCPKAIGELSRVYGTVFWSLFLVNAYVALERDQFVSAKAACGWNASWCPSIRIHYKSIVSVASISLEVRFFL